MFFGWASGSAFAQGAPPLPWRDSQPAMTEVILRPAGNDPDADIVRGFAADNEQRIRNRWSAAKDGTYDIEAALVGRAWIAPGQEPQILFMFAGNGDCWNSECTGFAITKRAANEGGDWVELTEFRGTKRGPLGIVYLANEPIEARLLNPTTYEHDIAATIRPENQGRRTMLWLQNGTFWDGSQWRSFCWQPACD